MMPSAKVGGFSAKSEIEAGGARLAELPRLRRRSPLLSSSISFGMTLVMAIACGVAAADVYYNRPMLGIMEAAFPGQVAVIGLVPTATQLGFAAGLLLLVPLGGRFERRRQSARPARPQPRPRRDCKQVCIGLVVTREGIPLGYEVFAGNRHDVTTVEQIIGTMENRYGLASRVWVMDRGMTSAETVAWLQGTGGTISSGPTRAS